MLLDQNLRGVIPGRPRNMFVREETDVCRCDRDSLISNAKTN